MRASLLIILISLNFKLSGQKLLIDNSDFYYEISPTSNFKPGIVSITFDDGYLNQFKVGMPLLKERNMPATFYVITDLIVDSVKSIIIKNLASGFEIGSHTASHADLVKIGPSGAYDELLRSKNFLKMAFGMNSGLTMSYPEGSYDNSVKQIVSTMYLAGRTTGPGYNSYYSPDRYALQVKGFTSTTDASEANSWIDFSINNHLWLIEMLHGINNQGYSPISSSVLQEHLDYIKESEDNVWCSNVVNVIKYMDESENAEIKCEFCNDTVYNVRIKNSLNDSIYDQPLSIKIMVPGNWDSISVSGVDKFNTEYKDNYKFILLNVVPHNQVIAIRPIIKIKSGHLTTTPQKESGLRIIYMSANPFISDIRLSLDVLDVQDIDISLYDLNGKVIIHQVQKNANGVVNLVFDTDGMNSGIYFLKVTSSIKGSYILKKMIKI